MIMIFIELHFLKARSNYLVHSYCVKWFFHHKSNLIRKRGLRMWDKTTSFWWIFKAMTSAWEEAVLHCDISTALSVRFRLCGLKRLSITNSCKRKSPLDARFACSKSGELKIEWRECLFNSELSFHESRTSRPVLDNLSKQTINLSLQIIRVSSRKR